MTHHRGRRDVDETVLVLAVGDGLTGNVNVGHEEDDDGLNRSVRAAEHEDRVGVLAVELPRRKHDGEHHEHLVERHGCVCVCVVLFAGHGGKEKKQCDVLELVGGTFRSCSKVVMNRDQSINRHRLRKEQVGDHCRRSD